MLKTRIIPCLLLIDNALVKTIRFDKYSYIGDPINTVRIFNELEVDELIFLDIRATNEKRKPNFEILKEIADECFMPLSYGGGVRTLEDARQILKIGLEKITVNSYAYENQKFITQLADAFGSQAVVGSMDVKKNLLGRYELYSNSGKLKQKYNYIEWARELEKLGAGELLVNSIDRDGTWKGYDVNLIKEISSAVNIPVIASGGAGSINDLGKAVKEGGASALAVGSMVVFQGKDLGVLVNFPDKETLSKVLY
jgi:cyclase